MVQMDVMLQTSQGASRATGRQDPEAHRTNVFMEFMNLKPQLFEGSSEHVIAERWLRTVIEKFDTVKVPQEYRVGFATYLFEGSVEKWWDSHMDNHDVSNLSWDEFETLFRVKYVPGTHSGQLFQGNMTVTQYHACFAELFNCDPSVASDPILKCVKFKEGLRPKIRSQLVALPMTDFSMLVAAALLAEADLIQKHVGNKGSSGSNKKMSKTDNLHGHNILPSTERYKPYSCHNCGLHGHMRRDCPHKLLKYGLQLKRQHDRAFSGAQNNQTQLALHKSLSGGEKGELQGSQGSDTNESNEPQLPKACHYCRQIGHLKQSCPLWLQNNPIALGKQQKSELGPTSLGAHSSPTQPHPYTNLSGSKKGTLLGSQGSDTNESNESQPWKACHYCRQMGHLKRSCPLWLQNNSIASGERQNIELGPPSLGAHISWTQPHPYKNLSGGEKGKLQGSKGSDTSESNECQPPRACRYCRQIGHLKRSCPLLLQNNLIASGEQQKSRLGPTSLDAHICQTSPRPYKNSSGGKKGKLQGSQGSDTNESNESQPPKACHYCRQIGHLKRSCPLWLQNNSIASGE